MLAAARLRSGGDAAELERLPSSCGPGGFNVAGGIEVVFEEGSVKGGRILEGSTQATPQYLQPAMACSLCPVPRCRNNTVF